MAVFGTKLAANLWEMNVRKYERGRDLTIREGPEIILMHWEQQQTKQLPNSQLAFCVIRTRNAHFRMST